MRSGTGLVAAYGLAGAVLVVAASLAAWLALPPADTRAVWTSGLLALGVQVVAFAALAAVRGSPRGFLAAWAGGVLLRFGVVIAAGLWLVRAAGYPPIASLLSLAGFVFALLLLEPVFLRLGAANR